MPCPSCGRGRLRAGAPAAPGNRARGRCRVSPGERATSLFIIHGSRAACSREMGKRLKKPKCPQAFEEGLTGGVTGGALAGAAGQPRGRRSPRGGDAPAALTRRESCYRQNSSEETPEDLGLVWFLHKPFFRSICKQKKSSRGL